MKIAPNTKLKRFDGKGHIMTDVTDASPGRPVTIGDVIVKGLLTETPGITTDKKYERFKIWQKFTNGLAPVEITVEEAVEIKEAVGQFDTLVMGQIFDIIDGKTESAEATKDRK